MGGGGEAWFFPIRWGNCGGLIVSAEDWWSSGATVCGCCWQMQGKTSPKFIRDLSFLVGPQDGSGAMVAGVRWWPTARPPAGAPKVTRITFGLFFVDIFRICDADTVTSSGRELKKSRLTAVTFSGTGWSLRMAKRRFSTGGVFVDISRRTRVDERVSAAAIIGTPWSVPSSRCDMERDRLIAKELSFVPMLALEVCEGRDDLLSIGERTCSRLLCGSSCLASRTRSDLT